MPKISITKEQEIAKLVDLFSHDGYFSDSIDNNNFERMLENIKYDLPLFLRVHLQDNKTQEDAYIEYIHLLQGVIKRLAFDESDAEHYLAQCLVSNDIPKKNVGIGYWSNELQIICSEVGL